MNFLYRSLYHTILIPVSLLPFRLLYILSDVLFIMVWYIFPYRKKIVFQNLEHAFPKKNKKEIRLIAKAFYRHLGDLLVEIIKTFTISKKELLNRVRIKNPELLEKFHREGKSLIAVTGHYGNWEWGAIILGLISPHKAAGLYKPLFNRYFDKKLKQTRSRFGFHLVSVRQVKKWLENTKDQLTITAFITDQSPANLRKCCWMDFLRQDTPVMTGSEHYARAYQYPVIYGKIMKIKRGVYEISFSVISEHPESEPEFQITKNHTRFLEKIIREKPEYWLWTHRRWKHSGKRKQWDNNNSVKNP